MNALSGKRIVPPTSLEIGYEKDRQWKASVRGDPNPSSQITVEGDTAFYAWRQASRVLGVDHYRIEVTPCTGSRVSVQVTSTERDPWYWLPSPSKKARPKSSRKKTKTKRRRSA